MAEVGDETCVQGFFFYSEFYLEVCAFPLFFSSLNFSLDETTLVTFPTCFDIFFFFFLRQMFHPIRLIRPEGICISGVGLAF